jgi:hypothetical protein
VEFTHNFSEQDGTLLTGFIANIDRRILSGYRRLVAQAASLTDENVVRDREQPRPRVPTIVTGKAYPTLAPGSHGPSRRRPARCEAERVHTVAMSEYTPFRYVRCSASTVAGIECSFPDRSAPLG